MVETYLQNRHHIKKFAAAMEDKMDLAADKGRGGWSDKSLCSQDDLSRMLREHVEKGDPIDVANFCMMLHQRGERISPDANPQTSGWKTIHTAPKDGTNILCVCMEVAPGREQFLGTMAVDSWKKRYAGFGQFNRDYWPATHWMPLPEPPSTAVEAAPPANPQDIDWKARCQEEQVARERAEEEGNRLNNALTRAEARIAELEAGSPPANLHSEGSEYRRGLRDGVEEALEIATEQAMLMANLAIEGLPDNAREREAMQAALTRFSESLRVTLEGLSTARRTILEAEGRCDA